MKKFCRDAHQFYRWLPDKCDRHGLQLLEILGKSVVTSERSGHLNFCVQAPTNHSFLSLINVINQGLQTRPNP